MKFIALVLSFCLSFNVLAARGTVAELDKHIDEFQYALTVEWDQKDQRVYEKETSVFYEKISSLMARGLTQQDIMRVLEKRVADKDTLEAMKLKVTMLDKVNSEKDLAMLLETEASKMYASGASWNGEAYMQYGLIALAVIGIGYYIWFHATHKCNSYNSAYTCSNTSEVYGTQCYHYEYCEFYVKNDEE